MTGTTNEAVMEAAVITALGTTGTALGSTDVLCVLIDDGAHTAMFKYSGDDGIANAVQAADIELMAILKGITAAEGVLTGDVLFA